MLCRSADACFSVGGREGGKDRKEWIKTSGGCKININNASNPTALGRADPAARGIGAIGQL